MEQPEKRQLRIFNSFAEAEEADQAYYRSLTGNERLQIMLEIMAPYYEAAPRFERVYRIVEKQWG